MYKAFTPRGGKPGAYLTFLPITWNYEILPFTEKEMEE